jgi:hypothetical protein
MTERSNPKEEVNRNDLAQLIDSLKYRPVATTAAQMRLAASTIEAQAATIENLRKSFSEHCQDCCCARSWTALGITEYTGKTIPEHIAKLREELELEKDMYSEASVSRLLIRKDRDTLNRALRDLVYAVDHAHWDALEGPENARLDDARSNARCALSNANPEVNRG